MSKITKTILISLIAVFSVMCLFISSTKATQVDELVVEYWTGTEWKPLAGPLFDETNFLPGQDVSRLIRVTNNSGQPQRIAVEAINKNDPDDLASQLNLIIREGATVIFNNTLKQFFNQGETYLSSLVTGSQSQYDFSIVFNSGSDNEYQGKTLVFNLLVGFEGVEGGGYLPPPGGGTGGGGGLPPGLTIIYEKAFYIGTTTATISWTTSYFSTSQVIYDTAPGKFNLNLNDRPPYYGYVYSKEGDDSGQEKVTGHTVTITGLTPNTIYYFRCVSHGSLAISTEHSFTTFAEIGGGEKEEEELVSVVEAPGGGGEPSYAPEGPSEGKEEGLIEVPALTEVQEVQETQKPKFGLTGLLAAIGDLFKLENLWWILLIVIVIVFVLFFLSWEKKKKKV